MWKASTGVQLPKAPAGDDDWETDPDFINDVTEEEQRWGSKTVDGSGRSVAACDMNKLREEVVEKDEKARLKQIEDSGPQASYGYGGKFGVQQDRMDQSAVGHDYIGKVEKHASQTDHSAGFGGKFGIQTDRVDKSAVSWDHKETVEKHTSQKDYSAGFGGKFGVQSDRVDKSAVGFDHVEQVQKHESQKDYAVGFGGKYGVQSDRQDKSALGWDHHEAPQKHESQLDHKVGFGGKFGVQSDRVDKCAVGFDEPTEKVGTTYTKSKPELSGAKPSALRARFENMAKQSEEDTQNRIREERDRRLKLEQREREADKNRKEYITVEEKAPVSRLGQREPIKTGSETSISNTMKQFNTSTETKQVSQPPAKIKLYDESKETPAPASPVAVVAPVAAVVTPPTTPLDTPDIIQNTQKANNVPPANGNVVQEKEIEEVKEEQPAQAIQRTVVVSPVGWNDDDGADDDEGFTARALYDYQAAADDEISFDPDDIITHIEKIDAGWWRGVCKNQYGLFPANYVELL